jgi:uncharacterized protein (DUF2236 family)
MLLGGGRALLLQVGHPAVGAGVAEFSDYRRNPWKRLAGTLDLYLTVVFGGSERAPRAGADLRALHRNIRGIDYEGNRYHALQPEGFAWVHATLVETAVEMVQRFRRALTTDERERYYADMRRVGQLYGLRPSDLPPDWPSFCSYFDGMVHQRLRNSRTVQDVIDSIFCPPRPPVLPVPDALWRLGIRPGAALTRLVTVGTLPPVLRGRFGLSWSDRQRRALERTQTLISVTFPYLPDRLRMMPPAYAARSESAPGGGVRRA